MSIATIKMKTPKKFSHPWVFQKMIEKSTGEGKVKNGSVVDLVDPDGTWVARGLYNGHSRISVRILTEDPAEQIDEEFFRSRIERAYALRKHLLKIDQNTTAYRLIHSEADGLSGLIVDRFQDLIVIEYFASGMYRFHKTICEVLKKVTGCKEIYWFAEEHVQKQESIDIRSPEKPRPITITEHGLQFKVAPGSKHKTGFFCDQRDNRLFLSELTRGGSLLDICCNSGGFSVYGKVKGSSKSVTALDLDEEVLEVAKENANLNQCELEFVHADLFPWLREAASKNQKWDVVVLDPAKQTRNREDVDQALKKYCDMNRSALGVVKRGGILATFSCSGLVSEDQFLESVRRGAFQAKREVQIFKVSGAAPDHPHLVNAPESRYLKAVWARVW